MYTKMTDVDDFEDEMCRRNATFGPCGVAASSIEHHSSDSWSLSEGDLGRLKGLHVRTQSRGGRFSHSSGAAPVMPLSALVARLSVDSLPAPSGAGGSGEWALPAPIIPLALDRAAHVPGGLNAAAGHEHHRRGSKELPEFDVCSDASGSRKSSGSSGTNSVGRGVAPHAPARAASASPVRRVQFGYVPPRALGLHRALRRPSRRNHSAQAALDLSLDSATGSITSGGDAQWRFKDAFAAAQEAASAMPPVLRPSAVVRAPLSCLAALHTEDSPCEGSLSTFSLESEQLLRASTARSLRNNL